MRAVLDIGQPGDDGKMPVPAQTLSDGRRAPFTVSVDREVGIDALLDGIDDDLDPIEVAKLKREIIEQPDPTFGFFNRNLTQEEEIIDRDIIMPGLIKGLTFIMWRRAVEGSALCYRSRKVLNPWELNKWDPGIPIEICKELFKTPEFQKALKLRGVTSAWLGLSNKQMLAIQTVTDVSNRKPIPQKLKSVGVKSWEWEQWLTNPEFAGLMKRYSEEILVSHNATVNMALVQRAEAGDLGSIKYVNELTGRWDPNSKQMMDVRAFLMQVIEILNSTIKDPDLLRLIGSKMAALSGSTGVASADEINGVVEIGSTSSDINYSLNL